jgi:hypothetical protein
VTWAAGLVVLVPAGIAGYYFWLMSNDDPAECTFDNFACARNRHFFAGVGWVLAAVVLAIVIGLLVEV